MNYTLFYSLLTIIVGINVVFGFVGKKLTNKNIDGYFLSDRSCGLFPLTLTFLATQLGGGAIVGAMEIAFIHGLPAIFYSSGLALGLFVLSLGLGARFRNLEVATIPELLEVQFGATMLRKVAAVIMVTVLFLILIAVAVSARKLFMALGFESHWLFALLFAAVIIYTTFGGLSAVIKTDMLQVGFILVCFAAVGYMLHGALKPEDISALQHKLFHKPSLNIEWSNWLLMPFFFVIIGQDMGQRCFAAKSPSTVTKATILAALLLVMCSILPVAIGVLASMKIPAYSPNYVLVDYLASMLNPEAASIFALCILMAIISTADSLLCAMSSSFSYDLFRQDSGVNRAKIYTMMWGIAAIGFSFYTEDIIPVMVMAYELAVATFFVPVILAVFKVNCSRNIVWLMVLQGVGFILYGQIYQFQQAPIYAVIVAAILSVFSCLKNKMLAQEKY